MKRVLLAVLLLSGCTCGDPAPVEGAGPEPTAVDTPIDESVVREQVQSLEERIMVLSMGRDAAQQGEAAEHYLARARLMGSYDDYENADQHIEKAFALSPEGAGPFLTRAELNYTLRRLDRVEADLDAAQPVDDPTKARIALARGRLRFHQGEYDEARALVQQAIELRPAPHAGALSTLALISRRLGDLDAADTLYADALAAQGAEWKEPLARLHVYRGLIDLDRGRYEDAQAHYREADALLPGWFFVDQHIAEVYVLQGNPAEARPLYERLADETGNPQFYDALAKLTLAEGGEAAAQALIQRARGVYAENLVRFPKVSYGPAAGHFLAFGPADRSRELARLDYKVRPDGEAATALIQAELAAGNTRDAAEQADRALKTKWRTAALHAAAAAAFDAVNRMDEAAAQKAAVEAINPRYYE